MILAVKRWDQSLQNLFLSQKLWFALCEAATADPLLYRHSQDMPSFLHGRLFPLEIRRAVLILLGGAALILLIEHYGYTALFAFAFLFPILIVSLLFIALLSFPVYQPLIVTVMGGYWAVDISYKLTRARHNRSYDLLCVLPRGELGAIWTIASASVRQRSVFPLLQASVFGTILFCGMFFLAILALILVDVLHSTSVELTVLGLRTVMEFAVLVLIFYMNYLQSLVLSALVGITAPMLAPHRQDATWIAGVMFITAQLASYGLFYLCLRVIASVLAKVTPDLWLAYIAGPLLYALAFLAIREAILYFFWRVIAHRTSRHLADSWAAIRGAIVP